MSSASPTLAEIGEFGLIGQITRGLAMPTSVSVGPGDDGAVFLVNGSAVVSTDILVEGVHFKRDWSGAADIGRKAVAVNVADLEAMGAKACVMVIAFAGPADLEVSWLRELVTGIKEEAEKADIALVGGDLSQAKDVTISVTVIGETAGQSPVLRGGAKPGQVVAIKGRLGWAAAGLAALGRGFRSPRAAVDAQRKPEVPYGSGQQAAKAGASAMIDISDGLIGDLGHIAQASQVVIDLDSGALPIADPVATVAAALNLNPLNYVLTGGEDHALAACFEMGQVPADWTVIGHVLELAEDGPRVLVDGKEYSAASSWTHFH